MSKKTKPPQKSGGSHQQRKLKTREARTQCTKPKTQSTMPESMPALLQGGANQPENQAAVQQQECNEAKNHPTAKCLQIVTCKELAKAKTTE